MAKNTVRHINLVDDSGQVYCHFMAEIVPLEGPHVATVCWKCPYWTGLAGGYGVECTYQDENLGKGVQEMTYRNAEDSRDHAPKKAGNPDSISDKDALKARDLREKVQSNPDQVATEVKQIKDEAASTDAQIAQNQSADTTSAPSTGDFSTPTSADSGVVPMKKATVADIIGAISFPKDHGETKHLPGKHDQRTHAGNAHDALQKMHDSASEASVKKLTSSLNGMKMTTDLSAGVKADIDKALAEIAKGDFSQGTVSGKTYGMDRIHSAVNTAVDNFYKEKGNPLDEHMTKVFGHTPK